MFIPGETIAHLFNLPFTKNNISKVIVSYRQNDRIIFIKTVNQGQLTNNTTGSQFTIVLTQQESLLFDNDSDFFVQLNVIFMSGSRASCKEMRGANIKQHIREVVS